MPQISMDWDTVKGKYPMRPLTGPLKTFMDSIPGTPCCVQMSHALIAGGCTIPARSNRRANSRITTSLGTNFYMLAVDEMHWYLEDNWGMGDEVSRDDNGGRRNRAEIVAVLNGRTGILVFREGPYGKHTELWDVDHMHQRDMSPALFSTPKVLFWDVMETGVG